MSIDYSRRIWLAILSVMLLTAQTPSPDACAPLVEPRLAPGESGRALMDDGLGLVMHDAAGTSSTVLDNLPEGTRFTVTSESPTCMDGFVWWEVRLLDGRAGFIAEGSSTRYFAEPWVIGAHVFIPDTLNANQLNHFFIQDDGSLQTLGSLTLFAQAGTLGQFWQEPETIALENALLAIGSTCPERLPSNFDVGVRALNFQDTARRFFPAINGEYVVVIRDYALLIPNCDGNQNELFGTSYVSLLTSGGDLPLFPFSQHSQPPPSAFCGPQTGADLDRPTAIDGIAWSSDSRYIALSVRYLRDSCAYYHLFVVDTRSLEVTYIAEGRHPGWRGRRLMFVRSERSDPNERLFSVLPDGGDLREILLPGDVTLLPESFAALPWSSEGDLLLACDADCDNFLVLRASDAIPISEPIRIPDSDPIRVDFVAGDTQLLWQNADGDLFLQNINDGETLRVAREISDEGRIAAVIPYAGGAILRLEDGRFFSYNLLDDRIQPIEGIRG
jgi:hypothetical protein